MKSSKILCVLVFLAACPLKSQDITVNQIGYLPGNVKLAIVPAVETGVFYVVEEETNEIVFTGILSDEDTWSPAQQDVKVADFTSLDQAGTFRIKMKGSGTESHPFYINSALYNDISRESMRYYYLSRVSMELEEQHAGVYARAAGHPDTAVIIHESASSSERPEGSTISTPGGWYDAGDYNKYVVNAGISTYSVFAIAEHYLKYSESLDLNLPESGNNVPDIIDEGIYNLRWMLAMQDTNDGGVYHKCTHQYFLSMSIKPYQAAAIPRYVVMKTTAATLNLAAVAAQASRILRDYEAEYPGLADSCLEAAVEAYEWAQANPTIYYQQPSDISTGSYGDGNVTDEFRWAAIELYITTLDDQYLLDYDYLDKSANAPGWNSVYSLGLVSLVRNSDNLTPAVDLPAVESKIISYANNLYTSYQNSAYKVPVTGFYWGSNGNVGNGALMSIQAYYLTDDEKYKETAIAALDYLLGRNPTLYCFVTGHGDHSPMAPHDRKSVSDGVADPIPGMLVGGPNPSNTYDCGESSYPSTLPALCYLDNVCSYSTNEITINWNAPLAYLTCAVQSLQKPLPVRAYTGTEDSMKIHVEFDFDLNQDIPDASDYLLIRNDGESIAFTDAGFTSDQILTLTPGSYISHSDTNIMFTYMPGELQSVYYTHVDSIHDFPVLNLVYGSDPKVLKAYTDTSESKVYIEFSKKMNDPSSHISDFEISDLEGNLPVTGIEFTNADSMAITFTLDAELDYTDTLMVSYSGSEYRSKDGGILKAFENVTVKNHYPLPEPVVPPSVAYETFAKVEQLKVYPNPSMTGMSLTIAFEAGETGKCQILLYDLSGRMINELYHGQYHEGLNTMYSEDINTVNKGLYLIVVSGDNIQMQKLIRVE